MAITFVGSDKGDSSLGTTVALTLPSHATDDVGIIVIYNDQDINTHAVTVASGWLKLADKLTAGGRNMHTSVWWKRFTSGAETNPTCSSTSTADQMSGTVHVFRGVDTAADPQITATDAQNYATDGSNEVLPGNVTTDFDAACGFRALCVSHDDITAVGTPSGYVDGEQIFGGTKDYRQQCCAYDLDLGTAGSKVPTVFANTQNSGVAEYHTYFVVLRNNQPIHITGGTVLDDFEWGDANLTVTGDGFEATQATGKVEVWDDLSGTTKTTQTIDSWSDTSIQIDVVQGSLPNNATVYVVVTNDSADATAPSDGATVVGLSPYIDQVMILKPDHYWRLNNVYSDTGDTGPTRDMNVAVVGTFSFTSTPIVDGNTHALVVDSVTDRREISDSPNMNITVNSKERTVSCWIALGGIQHSLGAIWKEGGGVQNLAFLVGYGNVLMWQLADNAGSRDNVQAVSDFRLAAGRPYHICGRYSHLETVKESRLYIDGVEQSVTDGNPMTTGIFDSHSGDVGWFDPDNNLETGGTDISYEGQEDLEISDFATWSDNSGGTNAGALDKTTEIRDVLFRRGAVPDDTISSDTESAMQTALDATADSRPDWPLSYRIEEVTGGGDLELTMTDKVFDARISVHLEYRGSDTLTIVNQTTSNLDSAKVFSATGGTIAVVNEVDVRVVVNDFSGSAITGARVLLLADSGGDLPAEDSVTITRSGSVVTVAHTAHGLRSGQDVLIAGADQADYNRIHTITIVNANSYTYPTAGTPTTPATGTITSTSIILRGVTSGSGAIIASLRYTSDQPVTGKVRSGSVAPYYRESGISAAITTDGLDQTIFLIQDS